MLADLVSWLRRRYGARTRAERYPFDLDDNAAMTKAFRSPQEVYATALLHDLGCYMRDRFARYLGTLRGFAESDGVTGVPFLVNLHGTDQGRGRDFPLAISQLSAAYAGQPGITSGSDHYLGDLTVANAADLYLANACMAAVHDSDQPLTSLEFEAGTGDYDEDLSRLTPPEAVELKTRLCVAQGNRLVNYDLFAGGHNPALDTPVGDGNDRIAFTGERHGFAAPVGPEGQRTAGYTAVAYDPTRRGRRHPRFDMCRNHRRHRRHRSHLPERSAGRGPDVGRAASCARPAHAVGVRLTAPTGGQTTHRPGKRHLTGGTFARVPGATAPANTEHHG